MSSRQRLQMHLQQQVDLQGTREVMSVRMSAVRLAIRSLLMEAILLEPSAIPHERNKMDNLQIGGANLEGLHSKNR
jgi:hypothetical protein